MILHPCKKHKWIKVEQTSTTQPTKKWVQCANCGIIKEEAKKNKLQWKH